MLSARRGEARMAPSAPPSTVEMTIELTPSTRVSSNPPITPLLNRSPTSNRSQFAAVHTRSSCMRSLARQDRTEAAPHRDVTGEAHVQQLAEAGGQCA